MTRAWAIGLGVMVHLGGSLDAYALDGHRRITQHAQSQLGASDGLPHNHAGPIARTSDGHLWSASQEGLSRFTGAGFYQTGWFYALVLLSLAGCLGPHRPARARGRGRR